MWRLPYRSLSLEPGQSTQLPVLRKPVQEKFIGDHSQREQGGMKEVMAMYHQKQPERQVITKETSSTWSRCSACQSQKRTPNPDPTGHSHSYTHPANSCWGVWVGGEREEGERIQSMGASPRRHILGKPEPGSSEVSHGMEFRVSNSL